MPREFGAVDLRDVSSQGTFAVTGRARDDDVTRWQGFIRPIAQPDRLSKDFVAARKDSTKHIAALTA